MTSASARLAVVLFLAIPPASLAAQQPQSWKAPAPLPPRALPPPPQDYNFVHSRNVTCGDQTADLSYKVGRSRPRRRREL